LLARYGSPLEVLAQMAMGVAIFLIRFERTALQIARQIIHARSGQRSAASR
jgi:hypothetical protein